ncbi:hypothetical protein V9T40_002842 [Parthenolecanium corni]|uniref:GPI alpha-1,4-mannosyltransferase I, catalytic subunit n=1 Tax=Parthenolecanium corni TaxID=536013 RepID=A0AAN9Y4K9_9HEMI
MDAVTKARTRLRMYPRLIAECRHEGKIYASCVASQEDIKQNACVNEFQQFRNCVLRAAVKLGTNIGLLIRILLCIYSNFHDKYFKVAYTDVDYKVFTYAARDVIAQRSPYDQQAYRYSPLIAYLFTPNVLLHPICGKIIASIFDVYLAYRIYRIVLLTFNNPKKALQCAQIWLYAPLSIIICTRGNVDSISSVFILLALLYHLKEQYVWSGVLLAVSVHLRLYPIIFLLPFLVTCNQFSSVDRLKYTYKSKLTFLASFVVTVAALTGAFYYIYGYKFINASVLFHVSRQDIKHNFSLYSYLQYLDAYVPETVSKNFVLDSNLTKNLVIILPSVALQLAITIKYNTLKHLPFNLFCSAFVFVILNKVLTAQYFIWFFSLLPVFLPSIVLSTKKVAAIIGTWIGMQALWLFAAYLLEFEGYDTFIYVHACSLLFYFVNVWILVTFINTYNAQYVKKVD